MISLLVYLWMMATGLSSYWWSRGYLFHCTWWPALRDCGGMGGGGACVSVCQTWTRKHNFTLHAVKGFPFTNPLDFLKMNSFFEFPSLIPLFTLAIFLSVHIKFWCTFRHILPCCVVATMNNHRHLCICDIRWTQLLPNCKFMLACACGHSA